MSRHLFWLSDDQWLRIEPHLPPDVRDIERADDRLESGPYTTATQSISMSNGPVHSGTQTKIRAGGFCGK